MIQGRWMPMTDEEWQLMEDTHIVTRLAAQEGVSKARIASLLSFMASAAAQQAAIEDSPQRAQTSRESDPDSQPERGDLSEAMEEDRQAADEPRCPECDEVIRSVGGSMGDPEAEPCGHSIPDKLVSEVLTDNDV